MFLLLAFCTLEKHTDVSNHVFCADTYAEHGCSGYLVIVGFAHFPFLSFFGGAYDNFVPLPCFLPYPNKQNAEKACLFVI